MSRLREISRRVAEEHGITLQEIRSDSREWRFSKPRQKAMAELYATGDFSLGKIGGFFNRHHTTVLHAVRVCDDPQAGNNLGKKRLDPPPYIGDAG